MTVTHQMFQGGEIGPLLDDLAALRTTVFRDWPYLYDGDPENEKRYLRSYRDMPGAVLVAAFDGPKMVGAATAMPLNAHDDAAQMAWPDGAPDPGSVFYCAESVLLPGYRGRGLGHVFFDLREKAGRDQGFAHVGFAGVVRPLDHPARPTDARSHHAFWRGRGYAPVVGAVAQFSWTDIGDDGPSEKPLQFWIKAL